MNITLNDTEIREALCEYAGKRGITITGSDIKIIAGRGENGNRAEIDISLLGAQAKPANIETAAAPVAKKSTGKAVASPFATVPDAPEVVQEVAEPTEELPSVTEVLEEKGAEVVKKTRKKKEKKDLFATETTAPAENADEDAELNRMRAETLAEEKALDDEDAALDAEVDASDPNSNADLTTGEVVPTKSLFG